MTQRIDDSVFPAQIRDVIHEKVDLEDAILGGMAVLGSLTGPLSCLRVHGNDGRGAVVSIQPPTTDHGVDGLSTPSGLGAANSIRTTFWPARRTVWMRALE
jgi:hypothetical protein